MALFGKKKEEVKPNDKPTKKAQSIAKKFEQKTGRTTKVWKVGDMLSSHLSWTQGCYHHIHVFKGYGVTRRQTRANARLMHVSKGS